MAIEAQIVDGAPPAAKKGKGKMIIIAAAAVIVLAAGGGFYVMTSGKPAEGHATEVHASQSFIFNLPQMKVNLNPEGGRDSFMQLTVALEVADQAMMTQIQPSLAKVVDAFQVYLRELRKSDLEGSAGIYRLREELLRRVNVAIAPAKVDGVLFKEIMVQ